MKCVGLISVQVTGATALTLRGVSAVTTTLQNFHRYWNGAGTEPAWLCYTTYRQSVQLLVHLYCCYSVTSFSQSPLKNGLVSKKFKKPTSFPRCKIIQNSGGKKEKWPTVSCPSVRPQECWIGVTGNHRRHPLSRTVLLALVRITGNWRSDCRPRLSRIDCVHGGRTRDSIIFIGEATFRSQYAANECSSHLNFPPSCVQIQYLNPSLAGWSRLHASRNFPQQFGFKRLYSAELWTVLTKLVASKHGSEVLCALLDNVWYG